MLKPNASSSSAFSERDLRTLRALVEAALPAGRVMHAADESTIARLENYLQSTHLLGGYRAVLRTLHGLCLARHLRPIERLSVAERLSFLRWLEGLPGGVSKQLVRVALSLPKSLHATDEGLLSRLGIPPHQTPPAVPKPRYMEQVQDGTALQDNDQLEADVVIIGSGAGGAVVAKSLAEQGFAVVVLEEGNFFTRADFTPNNLDMLRLLYRDFGLTASVGSPAIPVPIGKTVGGSTTVNSGTCLRAKPALFRRWRSQDGLAEFSDDHLTPYYERAEAFVGARPNGKKEVGALGGVIAEGCERLGIPHHGPLPRNAPDCDGQGLCCFGCPTDAKRSANVSWIPAALEKGALLYTRVKVEEVLREKGRAAGVVARAGTPERPARLTIKARAVVVACGSLLTPLFLEQNGLGGRSGQRGENLTIHPAVGLGALFPQPINGWRSVPQGYGIEALQDEGIMFEGAFGRPDLLGINFPTYGPDFAELIDHYHHLALFGFMLADSARGKVRRSPKGKPLITYQLTAFDVERLKRGTEYLGRIFFAAGATKLYLPIGGEGDIIHSEQDLVRFRSRKLPAWAFEMSAYHPLGTCKMGPDPRTSVVSPSHELHDLAGCFVVDGSVVNGPLGVNPQLTIMAMALRAAERIAQRLS
jgi:choline dehydrogenase-like flavoprotein